MGEKELKLFIKVGDDFEELGSIRKRVETINLGGNEMIRQEVVTNYDGKDIKISSKLVADSDVELDIAKKSIKKFMEELEMRKSLLETILGGKVYKLTNKICKLEIEKESIENDISKIEAEREYLTKIKVLVRYFKSEDDKKTLGLRLNDSEILENIDFYGAKEAYKRLVKYIEYNREINTDAIIRKELGKNN